MRALPGRPRSIAALRRSSWTARRSRRRWPTASASTLNSRLTAAAVVAVATMAAVAVAAGAAVAVAARAPARAREALGAVPVLGELPPRLLKPGPRGRTVGTAPEEGRHENHHRSGGGGGGGAGGRPPSAAAAAGCSGSAQKRQAAASPEGGGAANDDDELDDGPTLEANVPRAFLCSINEHVMRKPVRSPQPRVREATLAARRARQRLPGERAAALARELGRRGAAPRDHGLEHQGDARRARARRRGRPVRVRLDGGGPCARANSPPPHGCHPAPPCMGSSRAYTLGLLVLHASPSTSKWENRKKPFRGSLSRHSRALLAARLSTVCA